MTSPSVALVLLPGLEGTGKLFSSLVESLPDWIEPIVVSYPVDKVYDYHELSTIVAEVFPANKDFVVLGESFSGPLAVMAAARRPKGLKGIILCASFIKKPFKLLPAWLSHFSVGPIYELWPATIRLRAIFAEDQYKSLAARALEAIKSVKPNVIAARVKAILNVDVEGDLMETNLPILYLAGRKDRLIRRHNVTAIKRLKPDMTVAEMDTQHFVLQLEPRQSAAEIERFINLICE